MAFNSNKQHTIAQSTAIEGIGLHTGKISKITLEPADINFGIQFQRTDLASQPTVKADCDNVVNINHSTVLQSGEARVGTIEHLMAALIGCSIDNILIKINGEEVPILDGSSLKFVELIDSVGVIEQEAEKYWYEIDTPITLHDEEKDADLAIYPADHFSITSMIDFNSPILGTQYATLEHLEDFRSQIANSRTFTFLHQLEPLLTNGLIKGGDLDNAVVIVNQPVSEAFKAHLAALFGKDKDSFEVKPGYLGHTELRYNNEPARHKLLDIIGDLALVGFPFKGRIIANKPGHKTNVEFAKLIKQYCKKKKAVKGYPKYDPTATPVYDLAAIEKTLPHRYPFLLVDKIIELAENYIVGVKNITFNEFYFQGHFPGNPIMPGVLQIEALAQTGGILCINAMNDGAQYDTYFMKIDNCKFKQMVKPGDTLLLKMQLSAPIRRGICEMHGTVYANGKIATEADLVAQIVKRK